MTQDTHQRARERYEDAKDAARDQHKRMLEDLKFSNPSDPQQWDEQAKEMRKGRPTGTYDRTNQYIVQVVNECRKNKPGIDTMPADSGADKEVSQKLDGIIRHIEYRSRAAIAYDTAVDHAARCGLGWIRIVPEIIRPETNEQEITIKRVHDPLSIMLDPDSTEPDGSDAMFGFAETMMSEAAFKRAFPKAKAKSSWESDGQWFTDDGVLVCEYQYVVETEANHIVCVDPDGQELTLAEDDYWTLAKAIGYQPQVARTFMSKKREVKWCKLNGDEVLEETVFPSRWIGFIPVIGFELWVEGKRNLCGLTRRMMDGQRAYNYERSAYIEAVALQPKAPMMLPFEAIEGHEPHWQALNKGSPAYTVYNHKDKEGDPVPAPSRLSPPAFPAAFAQGAQIALQDLEGSIGMFQSNLGAPNNSSSGKQERERKEQGATATYHFADNLSRSIEHTGRITVDMIPRLYDTKRQARILGLDGQNDAVEIDPGMQEAVRRSPKGKVVAINPGVGSYDVRVRAGANYTTQRQEAAEGLEEIIGRIGPEVGAVLVPTLVKMRDYPDGDKIARMLTAMLPPPVQQIANEGQEGQEEIPPQVMAQMQQMQAQMQQMQQMLDAGEQAIGEAEKKAQQLEAENQALKADKSIEADRADDEAFLKSRELNIKEAEAEIKRYAAETARLQAIQAAQAAERAATQEDEAEPEDKEEEGDKVGEAIATMAEAIQQNGEAIADLARAVMAPKKVIRDETGALAGVVPVNTLEQP